MTSVQITENRFKATILSGQRQIGIWSSLCSRVGTEIIADAGFDWILFDAEHSPVEISDLYGLLQTVAAPAAMAATRTISIPPRTMSV